MAQKLCAAIGCYERIGPTYLMCFEHWEQVPPQIKHRIASAPTAGEKRRAVVDAIRAVGRTTEGGAHA